MKNNEEIKLKTYWNHFSGDIVVWDSETAMYKRKGDGALFHPPAIEISRDWVDQEKGAFHPFTTLDGVLIEDSKKHVFVLELVNGHLFTSEKEANEITGKILFPSANYGVKVFSTEEASLDYQKRRTPFFTINDLTAMRVRIQKAWLLDKQDLYSLLEEEINDLIKQIC